MDSVRRGKRIEIREENLGASSYESVSNLGGGMEKGEAKGKNLPVNTKRTGPGGSITIPRLLPSTKRAKRTVRPFNAGQEKEADLWDVRFYQWGGKGPYKFYKESAEIKKRSS